MAPTPLVSVVVPVFNGADLVGRALESLRRQTLAAWEALCVNDGSSDGTAAVLDTWAAEDSRVRVFHHPENRGLSAARNTALAQVIWPCRNSRSDTASVWLVPSAMSVTRTRLVGYRTPSHWMMLRPSYPSSEVLTPR